MSPEPTSVAAISPTSNVFPHNLFPETKRNGSLDLLVAAAVAVNLRDSDYSNTGSSPPASEVDIKLEQKRLEHERQRNEQRKRFEAQMKILELQQLKEEQDLLEKHHAGGCSSVQSASAPNTPPSLTSNDSHSRSDTMPKIHSSMDTNIPHPNQFDSVHSESSHNVQHRSNISSRSVPNSRRNSNETPEKLSWPDIGKLNIDSKDDNSESVE
ncbi:hypothetical protein C2G38_1721730 [Gigaspora rosea]|uniref:Uncharacterized protein n=1 Tax=Gigaspora rosea TaxID=44941 RepID=A0A397UVG2_9GLOM|nr:hypothetical protein C2G38_1721730 [Gigaspora rosea]